MSQPRIIVVPISGAKQSVIAVNQAIAVADKGKDKIYIVTAVIEKHAIDAFASVAERLFPSHNEEKEANARAAISGYVEKARLAGIREVAGVVAFGKSFVDFIEKEIVARGADVVVIGPHMRPLAEYLTQAMPRLQVIIAEGEIPVDTRALEEEERTRRIAEEKALLDQEKVSEATAHKIAAHYTRYAEREEQERRVREDAFRDVANQVASAAAKRDTDRAQDMEQCERVAHNDFEHCLEDIVRLGNVREANKEEREEQERRVNQDHFTEAANDCARKAMLRAVKAATERERIRQLESPTFQKKFPHMADFVGIAHNRPVTPNLF